MSELKAFEVTGNALFGRTYVKKVYLKSEADKVIAELEDKLRHYPMMVALSESDRKEIAELKKEKEYTLEHTAEIINAQEREIRHQKYKRCLVMAWWCASRSSSWVADPADEVLHKSDFYDKWKLRWRKLAEKFKEEK